MNQLIIDLGNGNKKEIDFFFFAKYILGYSKLQDVHKEWCKLIDTTDKRKLFMMPRGSFKSTLITVAYPIWKLVQNPNERILIANATSDNAEAFLREISTHLLRNEKFIDVFGKLIDNNSSKVSGITLIDRTTFQKEKSISTVGVLGNLVSAHYSTIIADDLVNDKDRESESIREKKKAWFRDMMSVLDPDGEIVCVGTRWHFSDLYKYIIDDLNPKLAPVEQWFIHRESCYLEDGKTPRFPTILPADVLERLKLEKGPLEFSCTPAETPILMADWTTKPISEVKIGEEVVGWSDSVNSQYSKLKSVKILNVFQKQDYVQTLKTDTNRSVRCTKDHKWFTSRHDKSHNLYTSVKLNSKLMYVCPIEENKLNIQEYKDWSYLAGIIDGEGSLKSSSSITITQCHKSNKDVFDSIIGVLNRLNIEYGTYIRKSNRLNWNDSTIIWLKNSFDIKIKLLRYTKIGKRQQLIDHNYKYGSRFILSQDRVSDIITSDTQEIVYALETETGNYVAWGYASSNSQYENNPLPQESQIFFENDFKTFEYLGTNRVLDNGVTHEIEFVGYCDLSIGKSKSSDFTGIVTLGRGKEGTVYIIDVVLERMPPDRTMEIIFTKHRIFNYRSFGVESNVFQSLFAEQIKKFSSENKEYLPVIEVGHTANKELRIQSLQPLIKQGLLKIRSDWKDDRNYKELLNQFIYFPLAGHDDGPDAIEGAFSLLKKARRWTGNAFFHSTGATIPIDGFSADLDMKKFDMSTPTVETQRSSLWGISGDEKC